MGGYQLAISLDIFRGRYRKSFEHPSPIPANQVQEYKFRLPTVNHVFQPGHRIMVQVQSSLFPLYDRNPQKYVPNIFRSEEHTSELQSLMRISYVIFCLKKKRILWLKLVKDCIKIRCKIESHMI